MPDHVLKRVKDEPSPQGLEVRDVQMNLISRGILDMSDPEVEAEVTEQTFGVETEHAVRVFQAQRGLTVDGVVGKSTWEALRKKDAVIGTGIQLLPRYDKMTRLSAEVAHVMFSWYKQAEEGTAYVEKPRGSNYGRGVMQIQQWFDPAQNKPCPPIDHLRRKLGFDTSSNKPRDLNRLKNLYALLGVELTGPHPTDDEVMRAVRAVCYPPWFTTPGGTAPIFYPGCIKYFGLAWCALTVASAVELACGRLGLENPIGHSTPWGSGSTVTGWYNCAAKAGLLAAQGDVRIGQVGCIGQPPELHHLVFIVDVVGTNGSGRYVTIEGNCDNRVKMMIRNVNDLAYTINFPDI